MSWNTHGAPIDARPTMMPSTPDRSNASRASCGVVMSPLPITGILSRGLDFTAAIISQSAVPLYNCERVRPCTVIACMPQSCSCSARSTIIFDSWSHPSRVFTVTGMSMASTTARVISSILGMSRSIPAPAPFPATFFTGQPKFMSMISGLAWRAIWAASTIGPTSRP